MTPLLTVADVVAGYSRDLPILHGVSLRVAAGEVVTIIGPNGAGKSTLIKAITGQITISAGTVSLQGEAITGLAPHRIVNAGMALVPQTDNVFTRLTIEENLSVGGYSLRGDLNQRIERAYEFFPDLVEKRRQKAGRLSGGQRQMLAFARALMVDPKLLLLDEPSAGLAPKAAAELFAYVVKLAATGMAVLMVEQNAKAALQRSERAYVLAEGRNRLEGRAAELLQDPRVRQIYLGGGKA